MYHPLELFKYCPECGSSHFQVNNGKSKRCTDCGFVYYFNPSAATVAFVLNGNNELLVCRRGNEPAKGTLDLPGGFMDMCETGEQGVSREVLEETGVHYEIDRLAVIHENFFDENGGSLKGMNCHELSFYFLMKPRGTQELHSNSMTQGVKEEMRWIPIKDLDQYKAFPTFLKDYLSKEHIGIEHIVTDERV